MIKRKSFVVLEAEYLVLGQLPKVPVFLGSRV